ncbi:cyclic pyranopterin monophosphate synthase subunit MoaA [Alkalispirillum mobile]|uniref:GTP 3',8-cyclase n=1 Tax=Alkalispirillum mobile TaxID=85925 RepID=A0A498C7Y6_9GAMM|nr:GTP 3',8-cyclase MoaA [Alkalispirillum mobile]RLK50246.1 cyclic pyranopterin monophosphate synthase subunit MoaA [Alkalispirillum mobile]
MTSESQLIDRFGRRVTYVRISVTDRCDFRCVYCMSEDMQFLPKAQILTLEELATLGRAFTELGVGKIRITGGEPLVRSNVMGLFEELGQLPGLRELVMTTNGSQLTRYADDLRRAGVRRLNISLDSLDPDRFHRITRTGKLDKVLDGIEAAREAGFEGIKINTVAMKNRNDDEIIDLVDYVVERGLDISFIEEMPLGEIDDHDRAEVYMSSDEVRERIATRYELVPTTVSTGGPSRYFKVSGTGSKVGFISPHSHNFCESCNRVRVTTEGRLLLCLGQEHSMDLRRVLRANPGELEPLKQAIRDSMAIKPKGHDFNLGAKPVIMRHMNMTGG